MTSKHQQSTCYSQLASSAALQLWNRYFQRSSTPTPPLPIASSKRLSLSNESSKTVLYLAYGSNLSSETFRGARGIKPLSAINVHVPALDLTFDLGGIPYVEPCFANTRYRCPEKSALDNDYHKDRWKKGLVGVVYEITPEDYRTIIATEGGGASYQAIVVDCYALPNNAKNVDTNPSGPSFKAYTLLSPRVSGSTGRISRPDPSYAQPSARYLKLITDGGEEHSLPQDYMAYLYSIRPYTITTYRQRIGQGLTLTFWVPIIFALLGLGKVVAGDDGRYPDWFASVMGALFNSIWLLYDLVFKKIFGDGERTINEKDGDIDEKMDEARGLGARWCGKV